MKLGLRSSGFLTGLLLLCALLAQARAQQDTLWTRYIEGTGNGDDQVRAITSDAQGDVYVAIQGTNPAGSEITTAKYSSSGSPLWNRRFSGRGACTPAGIALSQSGDVFVSGTDSLPGDDYDMVTVKYSGTGDSCWAEYFTAG